MSDKNIPKNYWSGKGRKIIVIPLQVLKKHEKTTGLFSGLFLTDIGYYPNAYKHYTNRKKGSAENILIYCVKGEGWVVIDGKKHNVAANTFFLLQKNIAHEYGANDENPWTIYWLKFAGEGLNTLNTLSFTKQSYTPKPFNYNNEAITLFDKIYQTLEQGYSIIHLTYVNMIFINFLSLFFFQHGPVIQKETTNPYELFTQKIIAIMKSKFSVSLTIAQLAAMSDCSTSHLCNSFKLSTGHSPIDYFNHLKIQKACQELYSTTKLIKEIAADLGFSDQYYFSRVFTKLMGVSPKQYRNRNALK